ncbi:hypothetical protein PQX77_006178 [Marasmius sp. AFHP31]|nr:hypothetical protein PQX77_006178 [Marasmius sp. AFHP31]
MVVLTSRVALIAASLSLAAISNAPIAEGVAVPASRASEVTARHAPHSEDASILHLPGSAKLKVLLGSNEKKDEESRSLKSRDLKVYLEDQRISVTLGEMHPKRSGEQRFFHVRRSPTPFPDHEHGHRQHPGHSRRRSSLTRRAPPRRTRPHPRSFVVAREPQVQGGPGQISLEDQDGKTWGQLIYNPSNRDVDASDKGTVWDLVPEPCPQDCEFEHCASFAIVDPADINKSRCITYSTSSSQPQSLHGYHCFEKNKRSNEDEPTSHRSQIFAHDPATGVVQPIPMSDVSNSTQPSETMQRRQHGKSVMLRFLPYDSDSTHASSVDESDDLSSDEGLEDSNSTSTLSSDSSTVSAPTSTVIATSTTTLTVTVAADSASVTSSSSNSVTTSSTSLTSTPTANALKVEVFGDSSSAASVTSTSSSSTTTSVEASATVTPTTSVDGDAIASSVAAEYSSSYSSSSPASATVDSTAVATNTDTTASTSTDATATPTSTAVARK